MVSEKVVTKFIGKNLFITNIYFNIQNYLYNRKPGGEVSGWGQLCGEGEQPERGVDGRHGLQRQVHV